MLTRPAVQPPLSEDWLREHPWYGTNWFVISFHHFGQWGDAWLWHYGTDYGRSRLLWW